MTLQEIITEVLEHPHRYDRKRWFYKDQPSCPLACLVIKTNETEYIKGCDENRYHIILEEECAKRLEVDVNLIAHFINWWDNDGQYSKSVLEEAGYSFNITKGGI